jgi:hypothetical protein
MADDSTKYLYDEYVRLSNRCTDLIHGSFDDIRLFGAVGVLLAWGPIAHATDGITTGLMFLGFTAMLTISFILFFLNAFKQSLVEYYLLELRSFESALRTTLQYDNSILNWSVTYKEWREQKIKKISMFMVPIFFMSLLVFPVLLLLLTNKSTPCNDQSPKYYYALIYGLIFIIYTILYLVVAREFFIREK